MLFGARVSASTQALECRNFGLTSEFGKAIAERDPTDPLPQSINRLAILCLQRQ